MQTKYQQNEVLYLVKGAIVVKCVIDEIIIHQTQKEIIVKYIVRPFGSDRYVTLDEKDLYLTLDEVKEQAKAYVENIYKKSLEEIDNSIEEVFDRMEQDYQERKEIK